MLYPQQLTFALLCLTVATQTEIQDANEDRFCYPDALKNTRQSCECSNVIHSPWDSRGLKLDCSYKDYKAEQLSELLPLYAITLDLSWNSLQRAPKFNSDSLRQLNLMHNNISSITAQNFAKLSSLQQLYLGWNSLQLLDAQAFAELPHLQVLNLAHNNLLVLPSQIFAPLLVLNELNLSWNRKLNQSAELQTRNLYSSYGINFKLEVLNLAACSLRDLVLPTSAPLKQLSLRHNYFIRMPALLPQNLDKLDFSENPLEQLQPTDAANLTQLKQLYMEDMPRLQSIAADALQPFEQLQFASFQNSRRLSSIDAHAFGYNATKWPPLRQLSLRGTLLRTFNITLLPVFAQLTALDLNGVPLYCDCELVWMKSLTIETNGRCYKPARVRGMLMSSVSKDSFSCDYWPHWVYGVIILVLIALGAVGIYLIVMGLRPHRGVTLRRKVGAGSPYARVTIEPNRQENNFH